MTFIDILLKDVFEILFSFMQLSMGIGIYLWRLNILLGLIAIIDELRMVYKGIDRKRWCL